MLQPGAVPFGRKGAPAGRRRETASPTPPPADVDADAALTPELAALARGLFDAKSSAETSTIAAVPWSMRAAMLAGVFAALLQSGMQVAGAQGMLGIIPGLEIDPGVGSVLTPVLLLSGVLGGGRIAAFAVMMAHVPLRALNQTSPAAYAIGGAVAGALQAYVGALLAGGEAAIIAEAVTGLAAGFLYRVFAGARGV